MWIYNPRLNGRPKSRLLETYGFPSPALARFRARQVRYIAGILQIDVSVGVLPGFSDHVIVASGATDTQRARQLLLPLLSDGIRKQVHPMMREAFLEFHDQIGGTKFEFPPPKA